MIFKQDIIIQSIEILKYNFYMKYNTNEAMSSIKTMTR